MSSSLRFIRSLPQEALTNMATDATLLEYGIPTLRLYQWKQATLSLGYFQFYQECLPFLQKYPKTPIVRRMTGGGAIYHNRELTFSLVLPLHQFVPRQVAQSYQILNQLLITAFSKNGQSVFPRNVSGEESDFFCYNRQNPYDLLWNGKKLIGCAQRRNAKSLLHHGSLPTGENPLNPQWNYLNEELLPSWITHFLETVESTFKISLIPYDFTLPELQRICWWEQELGSDRYLKRR